MIRRILGICLGLAVLALAACSTLVDNHGYVPTEDELARIEVGRDTRETVASIAGRPSSAGILSSSGWYYVKSTYETRLYRAPVEVDREVVAVSYDEDGFVSNIERFGLEDGQVVVLNRRVTEDNRAGIGFIRQLFGNLGNFNPADFFDDS